MTQEHENKSELSDPAAVFACSLSLWQTCHKCAAADPQLNLSESYNGMDEFMREVMRVSNLFEAWSSTHVAFEELDAVWPYLLERKFGDACVFVSSPMGLVAFDERSCLRVALRLRLPIMLDESLPLPIDVRVGNPVVDSEFRAFRIQSVRDSVEDGHTAPFTLDDDPFDENFGVPYFGQESATMDCQNTSSIGNPTQKL